LPFADGVRQLTPSLPVEADNSFCDPVSFRFMSISNRLVTGLSAKQMYFRISTTDSGIDGALMRVIWINLKVG
jgi:hypothetical protein